MGKRTQCRSCDAPIIWGVNVDSGKGIPLDPVPVQDGKLVECYDEVSRPDSDQIPVRHIRRDDQIEPWQTQYNSHFSTCPDADDWREKRNNRSAHQ